MLLKLKSAIVIVMDMMPAAASRQNAIHLDRSKRKTGSFRFFCAKIYAIMDTVMKMKKCWKILLILFLCSCSHPAENISVYDQMVEQLNQREDYVSESEYFNCELNVTPYEDGKYRYDVIIDQPKIDMENVKAIAVCESEKSAIYPSLGLEEGDICHLFTDKIDKANAYYEGVRLSGISETENVSVRVYVAFTHDHQMYEQYIRLDGEAK